MKGYNRFFIFFVLLLALYIVAEINRPARVDWRVSLSKDDKSPYGSYILYKQLKDIFPHAAISSHRTPVYDQVNNFADSNTAYLLIEPGVEISKTDLNELLNYAVIGNYVFIAAENFNGALMDTLQFANAHRVELPGKGTIRLTGVGDLHG